MTGEQIETVAADDEELEPFDFAKHQREAEEAYRKVAGLYRDYAESVRTLLTRALEASKIGVHSVEARAKGVDSFGRKASRPDESDSEKPKYPDPMNQILDLAGCRVITFFLKHVAEVGKVIESQFEVLEKANRSAFLRGGERLGYESVHYVVKLHPDRLRWPEYQPYAGLQVEIQVRTILQHAWAEIEHDIQYKSVEALPVEIRRRFLALAGMIEIGDREFQAIADAHDVLRIEARRLIAEGKLDQVEITPESLKDYLDRHYGPDGRMSDFGYAWQARNLKRLGFATLDDLNACVAGYDADAVSRAMHKTRQGQLKRLEDVVEASMGETYIRRHPWAYSLPEYSPENPPDWLVRGHEIQKDLLAKFGIEMGTFDPLTRGTE